MNNNQQSDPDIVIEEKEDNNNKPERVGTASTISSESSSVDGAVGRGTPQNTSLEHTIRKELNPVMSLSRKRRLSADDDTGAATQAGTGSDTAGERDSATRKILLGGSSGAPPLALPAETTGATLPLRFRKLDFTNLIERELMAAGNGNDPAADDTPRNRKSSLTMRLLQDGNLFYFIIFISYEINSKINSLIDLKGAGSSESLAGGHGHERSSPRSGTTPPMKSSPTPPSGGGAGSQSRQLLNSSPSNSHSPRPGPPSNSPKQPRSMMLGNGRIQSPVAAMAAATAASGGDWMGNMLGGIIIKSLNEDLPPPVNVPGTGGHINNNNNKGPVHPIPQSVHHHQAHGMHGLSHGIPPHAINNNNKRSPPQSQFPPGSTGGTPPGNKSMAASQQSTASPTTKDLSLLLQARSYGHSSPVPATGPSSSQANSMQPSSSQPPPISPVSRSPPSSSKSLLKSSQTGPKPRLERSSFLFNPLISKKN